MPCLTSSRTGDSGKVKGSGVACCGDRGTGLSVGGMLARSCSTNGSRASSSMAPVSTRCHSAGFWYACGTV